jgi:membrane protein
VGTSPVELVDRVRRFLVEDLWREDFGAHRITNALVRGLQLCALIVRGFVDDHLLLRASALTYMTSLAIIPILVVVLSIIQWLGLSRDLVVLGVNQFLAGSPGAVERIMGFVDTADVGALGSAGGAVFLVTTILSLRHVEETFNEVWGAPRGRSWVRRFTNYLAFLVVLPLLVGSLLSLSSEIARPALLGDLSLEPLVGTARSVWLRFGPSTFLFVAFSLFYLLLPNTKVKVASAMLGGLVAAILFIAAQRLYVTSSIGVARYNTLFGGFAFLPLLLVWIYFSWSIVLLGAEIAYAHQHLARYRRERRDREMAPAEREAVGLRVALEIARAFGDGRGPQSVERLSDRLGTSLRVVGELLRRMADARIVTICGEGDDEVAYQLGRPAEGIEVGEVLTAIRGARDGAPPAPAGDTGVRQTLQRVERVLSDAESAARPVSRRSLADLLADSP